jgi:hypothetical protein
VLPHLPCTRAREIAQVERREASGGGGGNILFNRNPEMMAPGGSPGVALPAAVDELMGHRQTPADSAAAP